jgi:hypothetical protein
LCHRKTVPPFSRRVEQKGSLGVLLLTLLHDERTTKTKDDDGYHYEEYVLEK